MIIISALLKKMEQFRQIGETLGSLKALMVFRDNIQINQRQCCLLLDILSYAYESIAEDMRENIKLSLDHRIWLAKAITFYQNTDCVEFHIHNLLSCIPIVNEAIETVAEISSWDPDEIQKKKLVHSNKYKPEWKDPQLFQWKFGKQYLVTQDFCNKFESVWKEDKWILLNKLQEKKRTGGSKQDRRLTDLLSKNLDGSPGKLLPSSILTGSKDYQIRRRLGCGSQNKEITWLGESFALRHFFGDIESLDQELSSLLSLSHPCILYYFCGFTDEEKKECYLVMELMSKSLCSHIKETCGPRKRISLSLHVAVDTMLQIARGMEYLHSKKIYHGDLNPSNVLVKPRGCSTTDGYLHVKVSGFGLTSIENCTPKSYPNQTETLPFIWHAPEVLDEQSYTNLKYAEKSDVYSFGMICFELLTGKVPFEDSHLQGERMSRNIKAGERPLFPFNSPKYLTTLTKKCWHTDPNQRPSFSSICRILRYVKRFMAMNPDNNGQSDPPMPSVDYCDIDSKLSKKFPLWESSESMQISQIPFQMFAYRILEKEKTCSGLRDTSESGSDKASAASEDEIVTAADDSFLIAERRFTMSSESTNKKSLLKKSQSSRQPGTPKVRSVRPPYMSPCGRSMRINSENHLMVMSPRAMSQRVVTPRLRRSFSGHASDSEIS